VLALCPICLFESLCFLAAGIAKTAFLDEPMANYTLLVPTDKAIREFVKDLPPLLSAHLPAPFLQALKIKPGIRRVITAEALPAGRQFLQMLVAYHTLPRGALFVQNDAGLSAAFPIQSEKILNGSTHKTALGDLASTFVNASRVPGDNSTVPYRKGRSTIITNLTFAARKPGKLVVVGGNRTQASLDKLNVWTAPNPGVVHMIDEVLTPPAAALRLIMLPDGPLEVPAKKPRQAGEIIGDVANVTVTVWDALFTKPSGQPPRG
jgi:hypothetical protein